MILDLSSRFVFTPSIISSNITLPDTFCFSIAPLLEIAAGITFTTGAGAYLEIG